MFKMSLKWKIFGACFWLSIAIVAFNVVYGNRMVRRSTSHSASELKATYHRYRALQRQVANGLSAAVDVWADSARLTEPLVRNDLAQLRSALSHMEQMLSHTIHPDFIAIATRDGSIVRSKDCPFDEVDAKSMRLFGDLRQRMSVDNTILEHRRRAWLVTGEPIIVNGDVVGAIVVGKALEKILAEFKQQSDEDIQKQLELALVHNQDVTAATVTRSDWEEIGRATRSEARQVVEEYTDHGVERVNVVALPQGRHDAFFAQVNGYDGGASGSLGQLVVLRSRHDREARLHAMAHDNMVLAVVAVTFSAIASLLLGVWMTRPIKQFIQATEDLAHGEGDLTRRLDVASSVTEMSKLGENLNAMFANLHRLASEVQTASFQVGASSAEISAASKQMLSGASDQAQRIESSTAAVTELSSSIQQVAENAMQATKVAQDESKKVAGGIQMISRLHGTVSETAAKIQELGESSKRISNIVEVIRQISEQTSLLALNASIEAAHAGEQGRGFAVVAEEVSSLARRVGQSAKDIELLISGITEETADAVQLMRSVTTQFTELTEGTESTRDGLKQIVDVVQDTARSVQEQAVVSDEIARNMDAVQKIAHEVLGSSKEAVVQGDQLHALALRLEELVRNFRIDARDGREESDGADGRRLPPGGTAAKPAALPPPTIAAGAAGERRRVARG
jgi:methyl-accepting chemotaxis protein